MKKLGFGLMRLPMDGSEQYAGVDIEAVKVMVDSFMEQGFTYFDTAYPYHSGKSELVFQEAVAKRYPRDSYILADKLPIWAVEVAEDKYTKLNEQLAKCGVEYFDYYLLHCITADRYPKCNDLGLFDMLVEKKKEGVLKHIGFSFHDKAELLDKVLTEHPEVDFVQLQINYIDWYDENVDSRRCYEVAIKHGVDIIVMEPVKGGMLANIPDNCVDILAEANSQLSPAAWAVRYGASLDKVFMVLSGMSNLEQLVDNTSYMSDFQPLSDSEHATIDVVSKLIRESIAVPCTACKYCVDDCPQHIAIPTYFDLYNSYKRFPGAKDKMVSRYNDLTKEFGKASSCIQCGLCEGSCPQHISIIDKLAEIAKEFE